MNTTKVKDFYDKHADIEIKRFDEPFRSIEFLSTLHLIDRYFPPSGHVIDIGAGHGRYSIELLKREYKVTLFDRSQRLLKYAKKNIEKQGLKAEQYICDDSRNLQILEDNSFDACLLMGPLYHIFNKHERIDVLRDTHRILRNNGIAMIAYLNSWGVIKAGVDEFPELYKDIANIERFFDECNWEMDPKVGFVDAYFSTPSIALEEVKQAGFKIISYAGLEGFVAGMVESINNLASQIPEAYENLLKIIPKTCELERYRETTEHLHIIAKKQ